MKIIILILSLVITHKDLNFYGLLTINEFDKEIFVAMDINTFPTKIEKYSFNDAIKSYAKAHFKKDCTEIIEIKWEGKIYPVCSLLSEKEKIKLKSCKEHLYFTFQKTRKFGKLTIFLTGISNHSS